MLKEKIKNTKPLGFYDGKLVVSKFNIIYILDGDELLELCKVEVGFFSRIFSYSNLLVRLLRMEIYSSVIYDGKLFFSFDRFLYSYDFESSSLNFEFEFNKGSRGPLSFSIIQGVSGFDDGLYFGEYFSNRSKISVCIYKRCEYAWNVIYEFPSDSINHIHALVPDKLNNCVWVLTGDFGDAAAIYKFTESFKQFIVAVQGEQIYRSCVAFPTKGGLLYATDSQMISNSLRLLMLDNGEFYSKKIADINGPSIYGSETEDHFIFSTSTEPSDDVKNKLLRLIDNRKASTILNNESHVFSVSKEGLFIKDIYVSRKDILPFRLFQFGSIVFPPGMQENNPFYSFSIANKTDDRCLLVHDINKG
ncbi:hypothetical protein [Vibrio gigantis]|uniref:hypothetical protein n=1 Tax=Vibrio gigantis TaxID=296199 RepID=UPI001BFDC8C7|nr:hypothetical protein [Vibrio gigantis]